jgi:hypothetical protein
MHPFFDWLKNSPPHLGIIPTTNPKMCAFSPGQAIQTKHVIFAMLIVPRHLLATSTIFLPKPGGVLSIGNLLLQ